MQCRTPRRLCTPGKQRLGGGNIRVGLKGGFEGTPAGAALSVWRAAIVRQVAPAALGLHWRHHLRVARRRSHGYDAFTARDQASVPVKS